MSYLALYRKFRPGRFEDVKGQDHIVTTLKNQLRSGRIGHAYLFCGTRGTGKTTIARILAKAVNCENPVDGCPCGVCETCRSIEAQNSLNVIEIDAASNNSVENVREIVEEVKYSPQQGRYKVYIIDEVHMLSVQAFNALLKTLEEPPAYVIFILATTEVHKLPITILSRCQRYDFKRISASVMTERLKELTAAEGIEAEEKALAYIARVADGSFRDALSLLDQCIAFLYGQTVTYEKVLDVLGTVDVEVFIKLFRLIMKQDVGEVIKLVGEIVESGRELSQFVTDLIWYLRNLLLLKTADVPEDVLDVSSERMQIMVHESEAADEETLIRYIKVLSELTNQIRYSTQKRILLEVALIKLCVPSTESDTASLAQRVAFLEDSLEKALKGGAFEVEIPQKSEDVPKITQEEKDSFVEALPEDMKEVVANWARISAGFSQLKQSILTGATPTIADDNSLVLYVPTATDITCLKNDNFEEEVMEAVKKSIGKTIKVRLECKAPDQVKKDRIIDITKLTILQIEKT
ncbi:MAG: DNA polymerase III subunit gamma/tau [Lachnospiraceae bacterium]|nr:DNA polymerase III subunit gamma/tau [Lachnospiraceae bacterium]